MRVILEWCSTRLDQLEDPHELDDEDDDLGDNYLTGPVLHEDASLVSVTTLQLHTFTQSLVYFPSLTVWFGLVGGTLAS